MEYASKGLAGTGLGFGIGGTALGLLNGGLGNILGGVAGNGENAPVNRYDMSLIRDNMAKDSEIALLKANTFTDQKFADLNDRYNERFRNIEREIAAQAVHNAKTEGSFALAAADLQAVKADLECKIRSEAEKRCCADESIVAYVNATFYPKLVADVTAGTTTTAQDTYNPLPRCGGCCNR